MDAQTKLSEKNWANALSKRLDQFIKDSGEAFAHIDVKDGFKLAYTFEIHKYREDESESSAMSRYETDLLFLENSEDGCWVPRLVVECKLGNITTHDALTYSAKAATHKHVHPYLRYGILVGGHGNKAVPSRLFKHGADFDFMVAWSDDAPNEAEWIDFVSIVRDEIEASRNMQKLLTSSRSPDKKKFQIIHRPLRFQAPSGIQSL